MRKFYKLLTIMPCVAVCFNNVPGVEIKKKEYKSEVNEQKTIRFKLKYIDLLNEVDRQIWDKRNDVIDDKDLFIIKIIKRITMAFNRLGAIYEYERNYYKNDWVQRDYTDLITRLLTLHSTLITYLLCLVIYL